MRIAIIGAGGVGGYFGGKLAHGGLDVVFIARGATLEALRTEGLRVDSIKGDFVIERPNATDDPATVGKVDAVFVTVKAWQIEEAAAQIKPMIGDDTMVIPLENGIDAPDQLAAILGREHVLGGLCGIVSFIAAPGHIRHIGADPFVMFGELDNRRTTRVEQLRDDCLRAGVQADIPTDIHHALWSKFVFIAPMSGIGAATRMPIGVWRSMPATRDLATRAIREIIALALARGVDLGGDAAVERTLARFDGLNADATSSLQRNIIDGKPSELDAQLGAAVRLGREACVPVPVCETLLALLLPQEQNARKH
ncbi:MAG TPA: 2-dehydropantoate 2-reductase [Thermoanaerobaculia bacterium]|jgi:2-dehydropantoate 2-reductase|nr:2-dehydropantoate 2-reductase [Thermoanaerobaculia bacterium]